MIILKMFIKATIVYLFVFALLIPLNAPSANDAAKTHANVQSHAESVSESSAEIVGKLENSGKVAVDVSYRLGVDDAVKITIFGESDLSDTFIVSDNGTISYPLIGELKVQGLSVRDLEALLRTKLSDGYLVNPSVSVEVSSYRPFYILGEVRAPGSYSYTNGITVLKAVALAGGFTYRANKKNVQVLKTRNSGSALYDKTSVNEAIAPGDIILVKERFF